MELVLITKKYFEAQVHYYCQFRQNFSSFSIISETPLFLQKSEIVDPTQLKRDVFCKYHSINGFLVVSLYIEKLFKLEMYPLIILSKESNFVKQLIKIGSSVDTSNFLLTTTTILL